MSQMLTVHNTFLEFRRRASSGDGCERPRFSAPAAIISGPAALLQESVLEQQGGAAVQRSSVVSTSAAPRRSIDISASGLSLASMSTMSARVVPVSRTLIPVEGRNPGSSSSVGRPRTSTNLSLQSERRRSSGFGGECTPWEVGAAQTVSFGMGPAPLSPVVGGIVASGDPSVPLMPAPAGMQQTQVMYAGATPFPQGGYTYVSNQSQQSVGLQQAGGVQLSNGMYVQMPQSSSPAASGGYVTRTVTTAATPSAPPGSNAVQAAAATSTVATRPAGEVTTFRKRQEVAVTTIMLRNIPLKFNRELVLEDLDQRGFHGCYDFFYLPIDFNTHYSVGYAFINFISNDEVNRFKSIYTGLRLASDSAKVCEINDAKVQGKFRNIEQYRNSAVMAMEEQYHPIIFERGQRRPFPKPTHSPKPFRPRKDKAACK